MDGGTKGKIGQKAVTFSVSGKIALTILNFIVGTISGSTALVAEAAHLHKRAYISA